jgi:N-methylhydantoinase A/oxoprolinase/acetone carboxylase beta subunit
MVRLAKVFKEMEKEAARCCVVRDFRVSRQRHERALAMRYRGQSFELEVRNRAEMLRRSFIVFIVSVTATRRNKARSRS